MRVATRERPVPSSPRGTRTRAALLVAAREVFERDGFPDSRMHDIAVAASVSHGTVYTWFSSKSAVLAALVEDLVGEVREAIRVPDHVDCYQRVHAANQHYIQSYLRNARLLAVVEQVALTDLTVAEVLRTMRADHVARVAHDIERMQTAGVVAPSLDARLCAAALTSMVEGYCRSWLVPGTDDPRASRDAGADLTYLWLRALGVEVAAQEEAS